MSQSTIVSLTTSVVTEALHAAGYRVETAEAEGATVLRSATNGVAFEVRFANPLSDGSGAFADFSLFGALTVLGELPLALVNKWNVQRRFGRLFLQDNLLVMAMDVSVMGGVDAEFLRMQLSLWDRLMGDLVVFLREELANKPADAAKPAAAAKPADTAKPGNAPKPTGKLHPPSFSSGS